MPAFLPTPPAAALRALNTLLVREAWARDKLKVHAGKTACLVVGNLRLSFTITDAGLVEAAESEQLPAVVLTVDTGKLTDLMADDTARRMGAVRIEGDAALAHVLGDLAKDLRWDVEDDLAGVIGDIPAARLVSTLRNVAGGVQASAWRFAENLAEYLTEESEAVASAPALQEWGAQVRRLRDDAERAGKRVEHVQARLARLETRLGKGA